MLLRARATRACCATVVSRKSVRRVTAANFFQHMMNVFDGPRLLLTLRMSVNTSPLRFVRIAKWFTVGRIDAPNSVMVPGLWRKKRYRKILLTRDLDEVRAMI